MRKIINTDISSFLYKSFPINKYSINKVIECKDFYYYLILTDKKDSEVFVARQSKKGRNSEEEIKIDKEKYGTVKDIYLHNNECEIVSTNGNVFYVFAINDSPSLLYEVHYVLDNLIFSKDRELVGAVVYDVENENYVVLNSLYEKILQAEKGEIFFVGNENNIIFKLNKNHISIFKRTRNFPPFSLSASIYFIKDNTYTEIGRYLIDNELSICMSISKNRTITLFDSHIIVSDPYTDDTGIINFKDNLFIKDFNNKHKEGITRKLLLLDKKIDDDFYLVAIREAIRETHSNQYKDYIKYVIYNKDNILYSFEECFQYDTNLNVNIDTIRASVYFNKKYKLILSTINNGVFWNGEDCISIKFTTDPIHSSYEIFRIEEDTIKPMNSLIVNDEKVCKLFGTDASDVIEYAGKNRVLFNKVNSIFSPMYSDDNSLPLEYIESLTIDRNNNLIIKTNK
jgi:hypothetical protein